MFSSSAKTAALCHVVLLLCFSTLFLCPAAFSRGTVVKHVDMDELKKYEDTLSDTDYQSLIERAKAVESMIQSGAPKTLDAREYTQAIDSLKQDASIKAEERKNEFEQNTRTVNSELTRLGNTFDSYNKDLTDEQRKEIGKKIAEISNQWGGGEKQRTVNQGLSECAQMMQELKKLHDSIMDASMSRKPKAVDKGDGFIGGGFSARPEDSAEGSNPEALDENVAAKQSHPAAAPDLYDYRVSPLMHVGAPPVPIEKQLDDLQKKLEGLNAINRLGTLENEKFEKELGCLKDSYRRFRRPADDKALQDRIKSLQSDIQRALISN